MMERDIFWDQLPSPGDPDPAAFSNAVRLTGREWLFVLAFSTLLVAFASPMWEQFEEFTPGDDYRQPHDLSNDYWLYRRFVDLATVRYDAFLVGDSVVWGEYVTQHETLSHYLNQRAGQERYANLGLDGAHPLALTGLVQYYSASIAGKNVLLHCNPLWLSSPKADLQDKRAGDFNHPRLVPQFLPRIPAYKEEVSPRIGIVVERHLQFHQWTNHLQQAYYDRIDIPSWTLAHPYDNPVNPALRGLPPVDDTLRHLPQPWYQSGIKTQDYPWVDLEASLQWQAFQRVVQILQRRENRVFVLVGPFNEHLLNAGSLKQYREIKAGIAAWLQAEGIPHLVPEPLPSELYGDASHPLAEGYAQLARQLVDAAAVWNH
jgi:hypothetical protein